MASVNAITGDKLISKVALVAFDESFDSIFGKKDRKTVVIDQCEKCGAVVPCERDHCMFVTLPTEKDK